jgi:hypothetical protein
VVSKGAPRSEQIGKQASLTLGPLVILPVSEIRCRGYKKRTARIRGLCFGAQRTRLRPQSVLPAGMKHSVESGKVETVDSSTGTKHRKGYNRVQTLVVSYDGTVYQKDLGPDTAKIAAAMELYNPDKTWHRISP